jgi:hypothetical protein
MLAIVRLSAEALGHPPSMRTLAGMAAEHELVLVGGYGAVPQLIGALRHSLYGYRVVVLLVGSELLRHERDLLHDLLNDGIIPVILTNCVPAAIHLAHWLDADTDLALPVN